MCADTDIRARRRLLDRVTALRWNLSSSLSARELERNQALIQGDTPSGANAPT